MVPEQRVRQLNRRLERPGGDYVLYWMTAFRRTRSNFALQHAVERARQLGKPLVVLEALRCGYRWASDRLHRFVLDGMRHQLSQLPAAGVTYYPYVERQPGAGRGLLASLARHSCLVVGDDYPCFFLPAMVQAAAGQLDVPLEVVDSNGLLPLRASDRVFSRAFDFRRFLQRALLPHLSQLPEPNPLVTPLPSPRPLPAEILNRWPAATAEELADPRLLASLPIDHSVAPAPLEGGERAASDQLERFLTRGLLRYGSDRNHPDEDVASGLSPYLHFGHISAHDCLRRVAALEGWTPQRVTEHRGGSAQGWWGMSNSAESFLDELVTWRELGFNLCWQRDDYDQFDSLPAWARQTLAQHAGDRREHCYSLEEFADSQTHDALWNAAQNQLRREGRIHNYLRMLWGKKILHWSRSPRDALEIMLELNNRYALDGRDPNSYSGIFWVLGRYDRAWGPERPVFGKIRYMSSANTRRKLKLTNYLEDYR